MRVTDVVELGLLAALWGGSFLFMRIAAPALGPIWLIELRVLLAGLVLLPLLRRDCWSEVRFKTVPLLILGCINSALPFSLLAFASLSLPAGFTAILNATSPLFGMVIASVWLQEKLTVTRRVGFGLGFAGVVVLVGWKTFATPPVFWMAAAAGLLSSLLYAIAAPYAKQHLSSVSALTISSVSQLSAALWLLPVLPFTIPKSVPQPPVLISVLALAFISTALAYILYFRLIKNVGSTKALTVTYLIPLFAMLWGSLVLREAVAPSMMVGCALILLGTAIANDLLQQFQ
jgi:drug/metabolite transporter (DMT)-like permease